MCTHTGDIVSFLSSVVIDTFFLNTLSLIINKIIENFKAVQTDVSTNLNT